MKSLIIVLWSLFLILGGMGSAFGLSFTDSFEGSTLNSFWSVEQELNGQYSLSSEQAKGGDLGVQSLKLRSTSSGYYDDRGQRYVTLGHQFGQTMQGTVSVWFYDGHPGEQTLYCNLLLYNGPHSVTTNIGVMDWDPSYYYAGGQTSSGRSPGWHKFEAIIDSNGAKLLIDDVTVRSSGPIFGFDHLQLQLSGPWWRPNTEFYFDQFSVNANPVPVPSAVLLLGSGLLGLVGWRRFRKS